MSSKPRIIVLSKDDDTEGFKWLSDGWYEMKRRGTPEAEALMDRAHAAIEAGEDVPQVIRLLKAAGFRVTRATEDERAMVEALGEDR